MEPCEDLQRFVEISAEAGSRHGPTPAVSDMFFPDSLIWHHGVGGQSADIAGVVLNFLIPWSKKKEKKFFCNEKPTEK